MALGFPVGLRSAMLEAISTFAGNGALLRLYSGTRPSTGGAVTTLLAELVAFSPIGSTGGTATLSTSFRAEVTPNATGTASWFRIVKADGTTHVMDGTLSGGSPDITFNSLSISTAPVLVSSFTLTEGNP